MRLGHAVLQIAQHGFLLAQAGEDGQHLVVDGVVAAGESVDGLLAQVADARAARHGDAAYAGLGQAGQHAQQRRLADAVRPDQADLAVVRDRRGDAQKDIVVAE